MKKPVSLCKTERFGLLSTSVRRATVSLHNRGVVKVPGFL